MADHKVVVVGAGIGGLVSALLLACRGVDVTLVERAATPGGKIRQVRAGGAAIDSGPTVFTMRWILEEIFSSAGASLEEHLNTTPLDILARHAWSAEQRLDLFASAERSAEAIGQFSSAAEARRFLAFCAQAKEVYAALEGPYIRSQRPSLVSMSTRLGPRGLGVLAGLGAFSSLWRSLVRHFTDARLQQLFGRYATYCGSSPFEAPATLMLIAQVEMDGVWSVEGGMFAVAAALANLAQQRGANIRYGEGCAEVLVYAGRACGVRLESGETIAADSVVFNGDVAALAQGLLGTKAKTAVDAMPKTSRSLSALTWSINAQASGFPLVRHNVFFDEDYASEFRDIFSEGRLPRKGTVYVCAQDRDDSGSASSASERLLCLVNAPAIGDTRGFASGEIEQCEQSRFAMLQRYGLTINWQPGNTVLTTPAQFNQLFPATGGALYGQASHGWMASFKRPCATSSLPGLYLAGGSVHPGPGVPMAAMSGRLAADALMAHLDSTRPSRQVATSGGTSMR